MSYTIFFGPESLSSGKIDECIARAQDLQQIVDTHMAEKLGDLVALCAKLFKQNEATAEWTVIDLEEFIQLDLQSLFDRIGTVWGDNLHNIPCFNLGGANFPVAALTCPDYCGETEEETFIDEALALKWLRKLGFLEMLGMVAYDEVPWEDTIEVVVEDDEEEKQKPPRRISISIGVFQLDEGYKVVPSMALGKGGRGKVLDDLPTGFAAATFSTRGAAIETAKVWAKQLCGLQAEQGDEVVSATVLLPDGEPLKVYP